MKARDRKYSCLMFLKDATDISLLVPGRWLYGKRVRQTRTIFMTPYKPPDRSLSWIGIIQEKSGAEHENPLLINVCVQKGSLIASGFVGNQHMQSSVEIVYKAASYERTPFNKAEMDLLWNKNVLILGLGTGGSKIALELARAGVGNLILCDPDKLEVANISRHEGDIFDVGKPKVQVAAERIYRINPAIQVKSYYEDIFERPQEEVEGIFESADLAVAATDKTSVQLLTNEITHKLGIPCVFGGCYEEALGGEVFFTLPGKTMPCLACLRSGLKQPSKRSNIDYSTASGPNDYQGQPGLHAAVDFVTCIEIQICLGIMLQGSRTSKLAQMIDPRRNFLLIGGALSQGFYRFRKPFDIFYQPLSGPKKDCVVCQQSIATDTVESSDIEHATRKDKSHV